MEPVRHSTVSLRRRDLVRLRPSDSLALHSATARVAPLIEASMTADVLADRLLDPWHLSEDGTSWLAPWRPARRVFDSRLRELSMESLVLRTDVKDCFGSITPPVVESALLGIGCDPAESATVGQILDGLASQGVRGLPVGPPASTVLANAVFAGVDRLLGGSPHLRWVDDIIVFCEDAAEAAAILSRLQRVLAQAGLAIAWGKTSLGVQVREISNPTSRFPSQVAPKSGAW